MEKDDILKCQVLRIFKTHMIVDCGNEWKGLIHVSAISDYYVIDINSMFRVGNKYWFLVESVDSLEKKLKLSWKQIMPRFLRDPFEFELKETPQGFARLINMTKKEVYDD